MGWLTRDDRTIEAAVGAPVAIPLKANYTIPYRWHLILPAQVVAAGPSAYATDPYPDGEPICGIGGIETFTVVAQQSGRHRLRFEHCDIRDEAVIETLHVLLIVR